MNDVSVNNMEEAGQHDKKKIGLMHCNSLLIGPEQHKPIICYFLWFYIIFKKRGQKPGLLSNSLLLH